MPYDPNAPLTNTNAPDELPQSSGVDAAFQEERFRFLVSQTVPFMVVSGSLATMIAVLVWDEHADRAVQFLLLIGLTIAARLTAYLLFRTRRALFDRLESWERLYAGTILFSGVAWGSGTFWVLPEAGPVRPVIFIFVIGMCAGASYYASTRARALIATVAAVILPCTLAFLFSDVLGERLAGVGGVILLASASRFILQTNGFVDLTRQLSVELEEAQRRAEGLARTDFLTGIENRRSFYGQAEALLAEARTSGQTDALVLLDIDRFKRVNDHFGHGCGDEVIRRFAHMLLVRAGEPWSVAWAATSSRSICPA